MKKNLDVLKISGIVILEGSVYIVNSIISTIPTILYIHKEHKIRDRHEETGKEVELYRRNVMDNLYNVESRVYGSTRKIVKGLKSGLSRA